MEYYEAKVSERLIQVKNYLQSLVSNTRLTTDLLSAKITVEAHTARANEALNVLQRNLDILIDSTVNAREGILQPQVVPPNLLIDALIHSVPSFPQDTIAPFPLSKDSTNLIYRIYDVHVYISDGILGYVITLPLVNRENFKIFKMIPTPVVLEPKKFLYIDTDESILRIDQTRQYYFMITNEELGQCKNTDTDSYICKQRNPLLSSHSCAVKLLQPRRNIPKSCETRIAKLKNMVWVQLTKNEWIYFSPSTDSVTILCNGKEPTDIVLE
jgi:hypothetical protein